MPAVLLQGFHIQVATAEMGLDMVIQTAELAVQTVVEGRADKIRGFAQQILGGCVNHLLAAVGLCLPRHAPQFELRVQAVAAFFQIGRIRHLCDHIGGTHQGPQGAQLVVFQIDLVGAVLVAGKMHQLAGQRHNIGAADGG